MSIQVDIQMPVRKDGSIVREVIDEFLNQSVDWNLYVDAGDDFSITDEHKKILELSKRSPEADMKRLKKRLKAAYKRNKLRQLGESPYVYLADPDVLLPHNYDIFRGMADGLDRHPRLGAIGVPYHNSNHVGAGSMMLRRKDFLSIGEIKGISSMCNCGYISRALLRLGLYTIPLRSIRTTHLNPEYGENYRKDNLQYHSIGSSNMGMCGVLPKDEVDSQLKKYGKDQEIKLGIEVIETPAESQ